MTSHRFSRWSFAVAAVAAAPATPRAQPAGGALVSGIVYDSISRSPLRGAVVQLSAADMSRANRSATADSLGRYALSGVAPGRYTIGFQHPLLDSLGIAPVVREVVVDGRRPARADLGIPSPARLRRAVCGDTVSVKRPAGALVLGAVRDAKTRRPVAGATVSGEWLELSLSGRGASSSTPRLVATTNADGWFALCNVPAAGSLELVAHRDADTTDVIEVQVGPNRFLRRELLLERKGDSVDRAARTARLSGTVVTADRALPIGGAHVAIVNGPRTVANERGEWSIPDAPIGTRMIEVRSVSFYPERRAVDVGPDAPRVQVAMAKLKSVLDTVKVRAAHKQDLDGFMERSRTGVGKYLTAEDVRKRNPIVTSDLFRTMPGVRLTPAPEERVVMRSIFSDICYPAIYLNGHYMGRIDASEIDTFTRPESIIGIEVYTETSVPAQFQQALSGCGSIIIWTR